MTSIVITLPEIKSVTISPNPVSAGGSFAVTAEVGETEKELWPEAVICAGDIYAGEQWD